MLDQTRVIGNLNFNGTSRIINIGDYNLTVSNVDGADANSFIRTPGTGELKINIPNGSTKLFPVGNSAYNPMTVTNNTGNPDYMSVRVIDEVYSNGLTGSTATQPRVKRTWEIHKTNANGGSGLNFVFNWNNGETYALSTPTLYHYENGIWNRQTGTTSYTANSLTYTGYTGTFSPFAIGNNLTPLPVKLVDFDAKAQADAKSVLVTWETSEESENARFDVQRSTDGNNWITLGSVEASGNSANINNYQFVDANPSTLNFYRLKSIDMKEGFELSGIKKVDFNNLNSDIVKIYPNPSNGILNISVNESATYSVLDINGKIVAEGDVNQSVKLTDLPTGLYVVKVLTGETVHSFKLIVN